MSEPRAKVLDYSINVDRRYRVAADGGSHEQLPRDFAAEHLVLAGLARCTLTSLAYHAGRAGITVASSSAVARGQVTKRPSDGRYAFVDLECRLDVELDPSPADDARRDLLAKTERDCFVGASFVAPTRYVWRINGQEAA
jgi:organic hydroperoxide reductase OsmC/OhrA